MKAARILLFSWAMVALLQTAGGVEDDAEVQAHKAALDLAAAFSNDGFKIRDGHWASPINGRDRALVAVNLYAGNQYWFSVGATETAKKLAVEIYDESGRRVVTEGYEAGDKAAAGYSPTASGQYFVSIGLLEGESATCCLIYCYK